MSFSRKILAAAALCAPLAVLAAPTATGLNFSLTPDANVFDSTTVAHATVRGVLANSGDVAWFTFTGQAGQRLWADHDDGINADTLNDTLLALFSADGRLLAAGDDMTAGTDPGSVDYGSTTANAFLGVYALPESGVYYLALSAANMSADIETCSGWSALPLPGGDDIQSSYQYTGCGAGFNFTQSGESATGSFTLHVSLEGATTAVPEPGSLSLAGLALAGLMAQRRRR